MNWVNKYKIKGARKDKRLVSQAIAHGTHCETPNMFPVY